MWGPQQEPARSWASASTHVQEQDAAPLSPLGDPISLPSCSRLPRLRALPLLPPPAPAAPQAGPAVPAQLRRSSKESILVVEGTAQGPRAALGTLGLLSLD